MGYRSGRPGEEICPAQNQTKRRYPAKTGRFFTLGPARRKGMVCGGGWGEVGSGGTGAGLRLPTQILPPPPPPPFAAGVGGNGVGVVPAVPLDEYVRRREAAVDSGSGGGGGGADPFGVGGEYAWML